MIVSFEATDLSWNQFLSSEVFLGIFVRTLLLHTPPPKSPDFSENVDVLLAKLPKRALEEALLVKGIKTDVINKDLEGVTVFF